MSQHRTTTKSRRARNSGEEFVLVVHHIPSNYRWQELKDLLRSYGLSSFKQSHTDRFENDGTFYGSIAITGRADAYLAYDKLVREGWNGHRVQASLLDSSKALIRGPEFSPLPSQNQGGVGLSQLSTCTHPTQVAYSRLATQMARVQLNPTPANVYLRPVMPQSVPLDLHPSQNARSVSSLGRGIQAQSQPYSSSGGEFVPATPQSHRAGTQYSKASQVYYNIPHCSTGGSSSVRSSYSPTLPNKACRTIRLFGISSATPAGHISRLMRQFGTVRLCHVSSNDHRGRVEAIVEFSKNEEALRALNCLTAKADQFGWGVEFHPYETQHEPSAQRSINPRQGHRRDTRPSTSTGPLVVNGARGCVGRRCNHDDTSDSDDSDDDSVSRSSSMVSNEDRHNRRRTGSRRSISRG